VDCGARRKDSRRDAEGTKKAGEILRPAGGKSAGLRRTLRIAPSRKVKAVAVRFKDSERKPKDGASTWGNYGSGSTIKAVVREEWFVARKKRDFGWGANREIYSARNA
jgi:hypothetical protein